MSPPSTEPTHQDDVGAPFIAAPGAVVAERYELLALLGRGAAGSVWEARHRVLGSRVAVKLLDAHVGRSEAEASELLARFRFEAQVSAQLGATVRNVIAVHDAGAHEGVPFLAMELVRGESLEDRLLRGACDPGDVAAVVTDLAEALDGLHARGIAHRDLKPANVLCVMGEGATPRTTYKLADFGVAKMFGGVLTELVLPKQTATNMLVGTPAYMSPEYLAGGGSVDGSGDLWALAVMAYELYTGRLPFDGAQWTAVAVAISQGDFEPPSKLLGRRGPALDGFFARALAMRPAHRYGSAGELARAFVEALARDGAFTATPPITVGALESAPVDPRAATSGDVAGEPGGRLDAHRRAEPEDAPRRRLVPVLLVASAAAVAVLGLAIVSHVGVASSEREAESAEASPRSPASEPLAAEPSDSASQSPRLEAAQPETPTPAASAPGAPGSRRTIPQAAEPMPAPQAPSPSTESSARAPAKPPVRALPKEEVF